MWETRMERTCHLSSNLYIFWEHKMTTQETVKGKYFTGKRTHCWQQQRSRLWLCMQTSFHKGFASHMKVYDTVAADRHPHHEENLGGSKYSPLSSSCHLKEEASSLSLMVVLKHKVLQMATQCSLATSMGGMISAPVDSRQTFETWTCWKNFFFLTANVS